MPDEIEIVVAILKAALDAEVSTEVPKDRPGRYVMVSLVGSPSMELLLTPRIALTCWGDTDRDAHALAMDAWMALADAAMDHPLLSSAQLDTMSRDEWTRTGQSRYLAEVDLTINV